MDPCPAESGIVEFVDGRLSATAVEMLQGHLDGCSRCFALVTAMAGVTVDPDREIGDATRWRPPERVDEYRVTRLLGRGAVGEVWHAHDERLGREVAIKFLSSDAQEAAHDRFRIEARAVARLAHPNVVTVFRVGESGGRPYLVSQLVRGRSLDSLPKPLPWQRALELGVGLARGLACAHAAGVVHRDIKPANAILGDDGVVKLLDFGLAKLLETPERSADALPMGDTATHTLTQTGLVLGTPLYMAPEAWLGGRTTPRMDVYSLGAVIHELCSGHAPFLGGTLAELRANVLRGEVPGLRAITPSIDAELAAVVARCLAQDPDARFASGIELAAALEAVAKRLAPVAPRRRRRRAVLAGALALAFAGAAVAWGARAKRTRVAHPLVDHTAQRCSADRWCWDAGWVGALNSVWGASPTDAWSVGERGIIRHFDGHAWRTVASPSVADLYAVRGSAADDVWAVGQNGTIVHWNGAAWSIAPSPSKAVLIDLWPRARDDVWAVGLDGETLRYDGRAWRREVNATVAALYRISGTSASDVWAVGAAGTITHFDGNHWTLVPSGTHEPLNDLWVNTSTDAWSVGMHSIIRHWDGSAWSPIAVPDVVPARRRDDYPFNAIAGRNANDIWLSPKHGPLLHFDGREWTEHAGSTHELARIWLDDRGGGWAIGAEGVALQLAGDSWMPSDRELVPYYEWRAASGTASDDVWAVGFFVTGKAHGAHAARFDGVAWHPVELHDDRLLLGTTSTARDDVWMVGQRGLAMHFDGHAIATVPTGVTIDLNGVAGARRDRAWAVGLGGAILEWDGATWRSVPRATARDLAAVWAASATRAWAVGEGGTILELVNGRWGAAASPVHDDLQSVWGTAVDDVWAVGDNGTIAHFDGTGWSIVPSDTRQHLLGIAGSSRDDIWAVGQPWAESGGTIVHWDGNRWTSLARTPRAFFRGVFAGSSTTAWAIGTEDTMMQFAPRR